MPYAPKQCRQAPTCACAASVGVIPQQRKRVDLLGELLFSRAKTSKRQQRQKTMGFRALPSALAGARGQVQHSISASCRYLTTQIWCVTYPPKVAACTVSGALFAGCLVLGRLLGGMVRETRERTPTRRSSRPQRQPGLAPGCASSACLACPSQAVCSCSSEPAEQGGALQPAVAPGSYE